MISKKPVKKAGSSAAKSPATVAKSAGKTPFGKKPVLTQAPGPQLAAKQQPVEQAAKLQRDHVDIHAQLLQIVLDQGGHLDPFRVA